VVIDDVFDAAAAGSIIFTAIAYVQAGVCRRLLRVVARRGLLPGDGQWEHGGGFSVDE
jgi:hypothetical protein